MRRERKGRANEGKIWQERKVRKSDEQEEENKRGKKSENGK